MSQALPPQKNDVNEGNGMGTVTGVNYQSTKNKSRLSDLIGFVMSVLSRIFQIGNIQRIKSKRLSKLSEVLRGPKEQIIDLTVLNGGKYGAMAGQRKKFQIHV